MFFEKKILHRFVFLKNFIYLCSVEPILMMKKEEVLQKFEGKAKTYVNANDVNISQLREYANVRLGFDKKTMDTFYVLPIKEEVEENFVNQLLDEGWSVGEDGETFILYLNY